jgi:hypothetical protein
MSNDFPTGLTEKFSSKFLSLRGGGISHTGKGFSKIRGGNGYPLSNQSIFSINGFADLRASLTIFAR